MIVPVSAVLLGAGVLVVVILVVRDPLEFIFGLIESVFSLKGIVFIAACIGGDRLGAWAVAQVRPDFPAAEVHISLLGVWMMLGALLIYVKLRREDQEAMAAVLAQRKKEEALARRGENAPGTIEAIRRTGLRINNQPQVEMRIRFRTADGRDAELTTRRIIDILEIPRFQPGRELTVRYIPGDETNAVVPQFEEGLPEVPEADAAAPPEAGEAQEVSATGAPIECPLWLYGQESPDEWFLSPRAEGAPLLIMDISDPFCDMGDRDRDASADLLNFFIAEAFWFETDMPTRAAIWVDTDFKRLVQPTWPLKEFDEFGPFLDALDFTPAVMWGEAGRDLEGEGITMRIRLPEDGNQRSLTVPMGELVDTLIDWMVRRGRCARLKPPAWYRRPAASWRASYARALDSLTLQILADRKNRFLGELDGDFHNGFVDLCFDWVEAHAEAGAQLSLAALAAALYAHRAGKLDGKNRERALALLRGAADSSHPAHLLSPYMLRQLGDYVAASNRVRALRPGAQGVFARWLDGPGSSG